MMGLSIRVELADRVWFRGRLIEGAVEVNEAAGYVVVRVEGQEPAERLLLGDVRVERRAA